MLNSYNYNNGMDYIMRDIGNKIGSIFIVFDSNVEVQTENMTIPDDVEILDGFDLYKKKITESKIPRTMVRGIIQKIVNTLKKKEEGEFNIPFMSGGKEYNIMVDIRFNDEIESARDFDLNSFGEAFRGVHAVNPEINSLSFAMNSFFDISPPSKVNLPILYTLTWENLATQCVLD
jgi:hypothetical protein